MSGWKPGWHVEVANHLALEKRARKTGITYDGPLGNAEFARRLADTETAHQVQIHHTRSTRVQKLQALECPHECKHERVG